MANKNNENMQYWREKLTDEQFRVLRLKETESPFLENIWVKMKREYIIALVVVLHSLIQIQNLIRVVVGQVFLMQKMILLMLNMIVA